MLPADIAWMLHSQPEREDSGDVSEETRDSGLKRAQERYQRSGPGSPSPVREPVGRPTGQYGDIQAPALTRSLERTDLQFP